MAQINVVLTDHNEILFQVVFQFIVLYSLLRCDNISISVSTEAEFALYY